MRYLILSDIHANIDALDAVLAAVPAGSWDRVLVLGDLVGYGAEPNGVIDRVRALDPLVVIRGNHDKAACGIDDGSNFNHVARAAAGWTTGVLTPDNLAYLRALPMGPAEIDDRVMICHGAPFDEDHYIFDGDDALQGFAAMTRAVCLFGHTHLPVVFAIDNTKFDGFVPKDGDQTTVEIAADARYLINIGAVGQPRDGDPRAGFGIYDTDGPRIVLYRVPYPVEAAQRKILSAGLPASLANRLGIGR